MLSLASKLNSSMPIGAELFPYAKKWIIECIYELYVLVKTLNWLTCDKPVKIYH